MDIDFLEDQPNVAGSGPDWMFDLDFLTNTMNYIPVSVENHVNMDAGTQEHYFAGSSEKDKEPTQEYILLPLHPHRLRISVEDVRMIAQEIATKAIDDATRQAFEEEKKRAAQATSINKLNTGRPSISTSNSPLVSTANTPYASVASTPTGANTGGSSFVYLGGQIPIDASTLPNADLPIDPNMPDLKDDSNVFPNDGIFSGAYDDEDVGAEANFHNMDNTIDVSPIPTLRVHKDYPKGQILGDPKSAVQTRGKIQKASLVWILIDLPFGKKAIDTKWVFRNKRDERSIVVKNKARLVAQGFRQEEGINYDEVFALVAMIKAIRFFLAFASFMRFPVYQIDVKSAFLYDTIEEESMCTEFEDCQGKYVADILKKFDFCSIKTATTPIESNKPLVKDEDGVDVDVYVYRSMISSLMYLTASRPDIMFAVCACARFQVTPKASHLNKVKRIFRYLKHQPKLGLWYPRDSPFELEAFSDNDYGGASLDSKSTTGGCQFLGRRLISWQCKKQMIVANSTTKAEYVAAANCCGTKHIEIHHHFIRDCYEKRLIDVIKIHTDANVADLLTKGFDVTRFNFLVLELILLRTSMDLRMDASCAGSFLISGLEMITSQLQGKLWLYDKVRTRLCLFCHHQIGQLEVHGAPISKEDINQKFLRSLPPSWNQIALIMRNKPDIDEIDIDDLYNNLRVYEDEMKRSSSSTSTSQNLAFLSSENTSSTNEVSTASGDFRVSTTGGISQVSTTLCAHDVASGRNQGRRSYGDNGRSNASTNESSSQALVAQDGLGGYDSSNDFEVEPVNYGLMEISSSSSSSSSYNEVESSKNLDELLNSQMNARDKTGLGYGTQLNEMSDKSETDSEISMSVFEVRSSDEESTPTNDSFSKADGYHVVPPPITGNFLTPRADISFAGLDEYAIRKKIIESKTTELNTDTSKSKTSETVGKTNEVEKSKPKINRDKVIIEDWNSDDEDDVSEVNTVSPVKTNETQTVKTQVDKIGQISQKEGIGFKKIKACFVCKSTDHLIKDCDFYAKKSPEPKLKTVVNTGQRVVKPVWDNAKRVNHQKISNKLKYPQARRTFVPSGVLTRTGLVNPVRPNGKRAVHTVSTARPISTARPVSTARPFAPKIAQTGSAIRPIYPRMDNVRPRASYSPIKRSYYTKPAFRPKNLKQDVKTSGVKNMTTVGTRAVVNTGKGKMNNDLKKSRAIQRSIYRIMQWWIVVTLAI
ncbi:putative ribonuclease H-like domain-containing protein [Tanacetum coccineum]